MWKWCFAFVPVLLVGCHRLTPPDPRDAQFGLAVWNGETAKVERFIADGASPNQKVHMASGTPIHIAAEKGNVKMIQLLIERGADKELVGGNFDRWTPLSTAADNGNLEAVRYLLENGVNPNGNSPEGTPPLARAKTLEVAQELIKHGADPNALDEYGSRAVDVQASDRQRLPITRYLIDHGGKPQNFGFAIRENDVAALKYFLSNGSDVHHRSRWGKGTPLHFAATSGSPDVAKELVVSGADVEAKDQYGYTPLATAAARRKHNVVKALIEAGADVNGKGPLDRTALHLACANGDVEMARFLLSHGANVDAPDSHGWTPLFRAATNGYREVVELLLKREADASIRDQDGKTAADWAKRLMQDEIAGLLQAVAAK